MTELCKQPAMLKIHPHGSQKKTWGSTKPVWRVSGATDLQIWKIATLLRGAARKTGNISTANTSSLIDIPNPHLEGSSCAVNLQPFFCDCRGRQSGTCWLWCYSSHWLRDYTSHMPFPLLAGKVELLREEDIAPFFFFSCLLASNPSIRQEII